MTDIRHEFGTARANEENRYQYYLTDHLGNTRVVLQEDPAVFTSSAGFEPRELEQESQEFIGYEKAVRIQSREFNHTSGEESSFASRLSGGYGGNQGLAKAISVLPGDTVRMEVFGKYVDLKEAKTNPAVMAVLMGLAGGNGLINGIDGALLPQTQAVQGNQGLSALMTGKKHKSDVPPAYLNYLFFDSQMNYQYGGFVQVSEAAWEDGTNRPHERLYQEVVAGEPGYFYIYLSNDSPQGMESEAFFDDFSIQTSESYIVQTIDYYPYGLISLNNVRTGDKPTNELFQGKTYDELTKWYDFHARQYDPALGRWFGVDPKSHSMAGVSPFNGMGNNPVMLIDPSGENPMLIGALVGLAANGISNLFKGENFFKGGFNAAFFGGVGGGLSAGMGHVFSAGLKAAGMGVQASNCIGGALGSFTGNVAVGGLPQSPLGWTTALGSAVLSGNALMNGSTPVSSKTLDPLVDYDLPEVVVNDFRTGLPWWWGKTNTLLNEEIFIRGGQLHLLKTRPLSTGATYPVYPVESIAIGGMATRGVLMGIGKAAKGGATFFEGAKYSDKVLHQMGKADDIFHGFPKSVDGFATKFGQWSTKIGADGKTYQWLKMNGSYGSKTGTFEYIKNANGIINHRFFNVPRVP